jgi:capsular polysaccharide export protein
MTRRGADRIKLAGATGPAGRSPAPLLWLARLARAGRLLGYVADGADGEAGWRTWLSDSAWRPDAALAARGVAALDRLRALRLPPGGHVRPFDPASIDPRGAPFVLVVDQAPDDSTLAPDGGHLPRAALEAARHECPGATILVLPDCDDARLLSEATGVVRLPATLDPWSLFDRVERVHVASSRLGLDALIAGCRVVTFGRPAYAGWGLTDDRCLPAQGRSRSLADVVAAVAIAGSRWFDPYDRRPITFEEAIDHAEELVRLERRDERPVIAVGLDRAQRAGAEGFLDGAGTPIRFVADADAAMAEAQRTGARLVAWASRPLAALRPQAEARGIDFALIEDGFLRSVGLGAAFVRSLSIVVDRCGIYYDPSQPSDLEAILESADIPPALTVRAARLRAALVAASVTKYNIGRSSGPPLVPPGRYGVLVPGQVEDDASILRGASRIRTNLDLLRAARARHSDAFLIYKPHPDVEAGYRCGAIPAEATAALADCVIHDRSITALFAECRAVETMTSLAGFEALLRGLAVATHGLPFYAGWGLTEDLAPHPRRTRRRTLDELVAAALILYPRYRDPISGLPCGPEIVLRRLAIERGRAQTFRDRAEARLRHEAALWSRRFVRPWRRLRARFG